MAPNHFPMVGTTAGAPTHRFAVECASADWDPSSLVLEPATIKAASGHAARSGEGLRVQPMFGGSLVLKPLDEAELAIFERLSSAHCDPATSAVPAFFGVAEVENAKFLRLENLTHGAPKAVVMDVKLGLRTFQERELLSTKPRPDLFEKALKLFPDSLEECEMRARCMTKARFMTLRDASTTTGSLGYRVDGVANYPKAERSHAEACIGSATAAADTEELFVGFAKSASSDSTQAACVARRILGELLALRKNLEASAFVASHEFVGSSLLIVAGAEPRVAWIDFAKSTPLPAATDVTHRSPWVCGNHEDGLLFGLDNLVAAWQQVADRLEGFKAAELALEPSCEGSDVHFPRDPRGDDVALDTLGATRALSSRGTRATKRSCRSYDVIGAISWPLTRFRREIDASISWPNWSV